MDVRISYGIDLEEVPNKINTILEGLDTADADRMIAMAIELLSIPEINLEMVVQLIDQARLKLSSIDRILNDSQMILGGYINAKNPDKNDTEEPVNAD
jgi:hypothetical protein